MTIIPLTICTEFPLPYDIR
uniref:Uncharacterized protein n=1 Tax=Arundo donax TaxID=35708 RepID=A0A0A9FSY3_ARUDO